MQFIRTVTQNRYEPDVVHVRPLHGANANCKSRRFRIALYLQFKSNYWGKNPFTGDFAWKSPCLECTINSTPFLTSLCTNPLSPFAGGSRGAQKIWYPPQCAKMSAANVASRFARREYAPRKLSSSADAEIRADGLPWTRKSIAAQKSPISEPGSAVRAISQSRTKRRTGVVSCALGLMTIFPCQKSPIRS